MWIILAISIAALAGAMALLMYTLKSTSGRTNQSRMGETEILHGSDSGASLQSSAAQLLMPRVNMDKAQIIGTRDHQEDAVGHSNPTELHRQGLLAAVADGIGGLDDGQIASRLAIDTMLEGLKQPDTAALEPGQRLLRLTAQAQMSVLNVNRQGKRIGSTLIAVFISGWKLWHTSIGDSRICLYRAGGLIQLNRPHVLGKDNDECNALTGQNRTLEPRRARALTAFLGKPDLNVIDRNALPVTLRPGDRIVLMSDGVFDTLPEERIVAILENERVTPAQSLVNAAAAAGNPSQDNATALVVSIT